MQYLTINKEEWDRAIERLLTSYIIYAAIDNGFGIDYELLDSINVKNISYNRAKPVTSLKSFFLPTKENVTSPNLSERQRVIIGAPNCDIQGLRLLDEIYLDKDFQDIFYKEKRENTVLVSFDCFEKQEHCHCTTYGIKPWAETIADLSVILVDNQIIIRIITEKGEKFAKQFTYLQPLGESGLLSSVKESNKTAESLLNGANKGLPDYKTTGVLIMGAHDDIWKKYSSRCVSCGACATICPTCSCFLLIDKPGFEKIKQLDACQYPGFERVAGGEDSLFDLPGRFRNRYMCKYVWKPQKFIPIACTGCGRCIEACIGKINKNELFIELAK